MITAQNWEKPGKPIFPTLSQAIPEFGHEPTTWLDLILNKGGKVSAKVLNQKADKIKAAWNAYIPEKLTEAIPDDQPKSVALAQLHGKTIAQTSATPEVRIKSLTDKFLAVMNSEEITPEEKYIISCECFPENPADTHINIYSPELAMGEFNGILYLARSGVSTLVTKFYFNEVAVLIIGYHHKVSEKLAHIAKEPIFLRQTRKALTKAEPLRASVCTEGDFLIITSDVTGLIEAEKQVPAREFICGPNQSSFLATTKRVALALAHYANQPLNISTNQAAARLAILLRHPERITTPENPFTQIGKDQIFETCPNLVTGFPAEAAVYISDKLNQTAAQAALQLIHQKAA